MFFSSGYFNQALSGNGFPNSSFVYASGVSNAEIDSYTIQFWVNASGRFDNDISLSFNPLNKGVPPIETIRVGSVIFPFVTGRANFIADTSQILLFPLKTWTNIVFSVDGNTSPKLISGYVNGILSLTGKIFDNTAFLKQGRELAMSVNAGAIDELRLWSGALSSGEIFSGFNQQINKPEEKENLLHYFKFDGSGNVTPINNYFFYKNGLLTNSGSVSGSTSSLQFGSSSIGARLSGQLDEFRLWSGVRSSGEIYQYWNAPMTDYPGFAQSGLLSYVPFGTGVFTGNGIDFSELDFSMTDFH